MRNSSLILIFLLSSLEVAFPSPAPHEDYLVLHLAHPHPRDCPPPHFVHTRHDDGSIDSVNADDWPALGSEGGDARNVLKSKVAKKSVKASVKEVVRKNEPGSAATPDNDDAGDDSGNDAGDDSGNDAGDDSGNDVAGDGHAGNDDDSGNDDENDDDDGNDDGNDDEREGGGRKEVSHSEKVTKSKAKSAKSSHRAAEKGANRTVKPDKDDDHSGEKGNDNQVKY